MPIADLASARAFLTSGPGKIDASPIQARDPLSTRLAGQIAGLLRQAAAIEARVPPSKGSCAGLSLEELLAGTCNNPEAIAPSREAVTAWFHQASAAAEESWRAQHWGDLARGALPAKTTTFQLIWEMGQTIPASGYTNGPVLPDQSEIRAEARRKREAQVAAEAVLVGAQQPAGAASGVQDFAE